MSSGEPVGY